MILLCTGGNGAALDHFLHHPLVIVWQPVIGHLPTVPLTSSQVVTSRSVNWGQQNRYII